MTQTSESRLDRLEALAETTLLAIQALSDRDTQFADRQEALAQRQETLAERQEATQAQFEQIRGQFDQIRVQQEFNAEQIAANTAGLVELRNLFADFIRAQR